MLQANKLLLHFMPTTRTFLAVLPHFIVYIISFAADEMIAELEREYILQRQREGIAIAKENGVYKGRKPIVCAGFDSVFMLWHRREITAVEAQKQLGLSPSTFYRKVREYEKQIGKGEET